MLVSAQPCGPPQFVPTPQMRDTAAVRNPDGDGDLQTCIGSCLTYLNCTAVDFNTALECSMTIDDNAQLVDDPDTTHYAGQRNCTEGSVSE